MHGPPVFAAHVGVFGGADGGVRGLLGHGGFGEEFRAEVLDGERVVVAHNLLGPFAAGVLALPGDLLVRLGA
jgi:hypothetical protein